MSARAIPPTCGRRFETAITRDARIPLSDDDREMADGWRCVPIPPTADGDWFVVDSSSDRKTKWGRWCVEGRA